MIKPNAYICLLFFTSTCSIAFCIPHTSQELKHVSDRQTDPIAIPCDIANVKSRAVCKKVLDGVKAGLRASGVVIGETTSTFTINTDKNDNIRSKCSGTIHLHHQNIIATAPVGIHVPFTGDVLLNPAILDIKAPIQVSAKFDLSYSQGVPLLGSCFHYNSHKFSIHANIYTNVHLYAKLFVNMSTTDSANEDEVTIRPQVECEFQYEGKHSHSWRQTGMNRYVYKAFRGRLEKLAGKTFKKAMRRRGKFFSKQIQTKAKEVIKTQLKTNSNGVAIIDISN